MNEYALLQILHQANYESLALAMSRYADRMDQFADSINRDKYGAVSAHAVAAAANELSHRLMDLRLMWGK